MFPQHSKPSPSPSPRALGTAIGAFLAFFLLLGLYSWFLFRRHRRRNLQSRQSQQNLSLARTDTEVSTEADLEAFLATPSQIHLHAHPPILRSDPASVASRNNHLHPTSSRASITRAAIIQADTETVPPQPTHPTLPNYPPPLYTKHPAKTEARLDAGWDLPGYMASGCASPSSEITSPFRVAVRDGHTGVTVPRQSAVERSKYIWPFSHTQQGHREERRRRRVKRKERERVRCMRMYGADAGRVGVQSLAPAMIFF